MEIEDAVIMKTRTVKHQVATSKQKFESDDSEGSDLSYESSLSEEEDSSMGRIEYFREQMARFFINYPELINKNMVSQQQIPHGEDQEAVREAKVRQNWHSISKQILTETKESATSLESLAKRIALYRTKTDHSDVVDIIMRDKDTILREINAEIAQKNIESANMNAKEKRDTFTEKNNHEDNTYYSWRKRKEIESKSLHNRVQKSSSQMNLKRQGSNDRREVKKENMSPGRTAQNPGQTRRGRSLKTRFEGKTQELRQDNNTMEESQVATGNHNKNAWKHMVNFEPKTEIGKQLCEQIRKNHNPHDQLGIKKTIVCFLAKYKGMVDNQIINKVTLSQKIQKLYSEDSKELLMFYPSKLNNIDTPGSLSSSMSKDSSNDDRFLAMLKEISEGALIKYWKQLQEKKL